MAKSDDQFSEEETARCRDDVIRRMANTPPKPHSEMKVGKRKAKRDREDGALKRKAKPIRAEQR